MYTLLVEALAMLLDGRRRPRPGAGAGPRRRGGAADALSHALGVARRLVTASSTARCVAALRRLDARVPERRARHGDHAAASRITRRCPIGPAAAILEAVRAGLTEGLPAGLAWRRAASGADASDDGRAGIDRFFARRSCAPLRRDDA